MIKEYEYLVFNVAGITFENRERNLIKLLNRFEKEGYFEKYGGYTNKEIKESYMEVFEYEDFSTTDVQITETIVDDKPAYEIHLMDYDGNYVMVGYIPKKVIKEYTAMIQKYNLTSASASIVGGRLKEVEDDDEGNEKVVTKDHLNIGVEIKLAFKLNEPIYTCNNCKKEISEEIHSNNKGLCEECSKHKEIVKDNLPPSEKLINDARERKNKALIFLIISIVLTFAFIPLILLDIILFIIFIAFYMEYIRLKESYK